MTVIQLLVANIVALAFITIVYFYTGWDKIISCYKLWLNRQYWSNYNIVEAVSWLTKAIIIVPGLIFNIQLWWLYLLTLITSITLIWASNKKLLPTLVGFNTLWVWLSCMILAQHLL